MLEQKEITNLATLTAGIQTCILPNAKPGYINALIQLRSFYLKKSIESSYLQVLAFERKGLYERHSHPFITYMEYLIKLLRAECITMALIIPDAFVRSTQADLCRGSLDNFKEACLSIIAKVKSSASLKQDGADIFILLDLYDHVSDTCLANEDAGPFVSVFSLLGCLVLLAVTFSFRVDGTSAPDAPSLK